jgi:hypothetical protein
MVGGVSQLQVENKKNALLAAENAMRVVQSRLSELDAKQSLEAGQAKSQLETSGQELSKLRLQSEAADHEVGQRGRQAAVAGADRAPGGRRRGAHQVRKHRQGKIPANRYPG